METLQFFYDYECPHCKAGYENIMKQIGNHPNIKIEWRPIELNPSSGKVSPGINPAGQSYYIAEELGAEISAFHTAMYRAIAVERKNAGKPEVLCNVLKGIVDTGKFRAILDSGKYANQAAENNKLAYDKNDVWYLPALRAKGKRLDAKPGAGISPRELESFLSSLA